MCNKTDVVVNEMGGSMSRIWNELCQIESDEVRYHMLITTLSSPEYVAAAKRAGIYADVLTWVGAYREGVGYTWPYQRGSVNSSSQSRWQMYTTPISGGAGRASSQQQNPHQNQYTQQQQYASQSQYPYANQYAPPSQPSYAPPSQPSYAPPSQPSYAPPSQPQNQHIIVSPAARAMDYFQEALLLLGIQEHEQLTSRRLKEAYRQTSLQAHPDKGGSSEQFDAVRRAYQYIEQVLRRINPEHSAEEKHRMSAPVSMERAVAERAAAAVPPITLSAKKLDMTTFNRLFEENRLPDPTADTGYGDWLRGQGGSDSVVADPRMKGKFNQQMFETIFREKAAANSTAITKRHEPDALVAPIGTELGSTAKNFTAAFGSDVQFTDVKEAYTTGSTVFQEIADVRVSDRRVRTIGEAKRIREAEMARVDPDEKSRIAAAAAALEERERQRRLNLAKQDVAAERWHDMMRQRLHISDR